MPFKIIRNDITKLETDAIVNAANCNLLAGGGVCGAIFAAAGAEQLQAECNKIGHCDVGNAVVTKGYRLKAKYIIHTVGPIYGEDPANEEKQLFNCYINALKLAKRKRVKSIAFPLISSGIYGYPKAEAMKIATRAIKEFLNGYDMEIFLVVYDKQSFSVSEKLFSDVKSYIDEHSVVHQLRRESECTYYPMQMDIQGDGMQDFAINIPEEYSTSPILNTINSNSQSYRETDADVKKFMKKIPENSEPVKRKLTPRLSLDELLNKKTETFSQMLLRIIDEKGMTDVEVYKRANIDRRLFSKIRKKDYTPKKVTVVALAIALKLNRGEAKEFLGRAGFAFTQSSKFDIIIEYFIEQGNYDIFEINEILFEFDQQLLGA